MSLVELSLTTKVNFDSLTINTKIDKRKTNSQLLSNISEKYN